jgi:hypothetical protein
MTEQAMARKFSRWLREQARTQPIYFLKVHGHRHQRAGVADYWMAINGKSVQVELKGPGKLPVGTPIQENELRKHSDAGGYSWVATDIRACQAVVLYHLGDSNDEALLPFFEAGILRDVASPIN